MKKRALPILLAFVLIVSFFPKMTLAADITPKSETAYVDLHSDGSVKTVYIVNAFEIEGGGSIVDYGEYVEIKNLTDSSAITNDNGRIAAHSSNDLFYYQGILGITDLPWDLEIEYYLDGNKVNADELAGCTGAFELRIHVNKGDEKYQSFFERYMMQISLSLNKDLCTNIQSEGAGINIVGKTASISYTHAMNTEASYILTANVHDFEMSAIQLRAAAMGNLGLDIDIDGDILSEFDSLSDGVTTLNESAAKLADGSDSFHGGLRSMAAKTNDFASSINTLYQGAGMLNDAAALFGEGISEVGGRLGSLSESMPKLQEAVNQLAEGSTDFSKHLTTYCSGIAALAQASSGISQNISTFHQKASSLSLPNEESNEELLIYAKLLALNSEVPEDDPAKALAKALLTQNAVLLLQNAALAEMKTGISTLDGSYAQLNEKLQTAAEAGEKLIAGCETLDSSIWQLSYGISTLALALDTFASDGVAKLEVSYAQIQEGINGIYDALATINATVADTLVPGISTMASSYQTLNDGAEKLAEAIATLDESVADIPDMLGGKIDEYLGSYLPSDDAIGSFVSDRNTVTSVLFIMQTDEIMKPTVNIQELPTVRQPATFWEKLLNLFGLFRP